MHAGIFAVLWRNASSFTILDGEISYAVNTCVNAISRLKSGSFSENLSRVKPDSRTQRKNYVLNVCKLNSKAFVSILITRCL